MTSFIWPFLALCQEVGFENSVWNSLSVLTWDKNLNLFLLLGPICTPSVLLGVITMPQKMKENWKLPSSTRKEIRKFRRNHRSLYICDRNKNNKKTHTLCPECMCKGNFQTAAGKRGLCFICTLGYEQLQFRKCLPVWTY